MNLHNTFSPSFFPLQTSPSRVTFQYIPSCLVSNETNELRQKHCQTAGAIVESVVRDLCYSLSQTGDMLGLVPRPVTHVLNNNACRGECLALCRRKDVAAALYHNQALVLNLLKSLKFHTFAQKIRNLCILLYFLTL